MQTGFILLLLMWKVFVFTTVWKSLTATLQSSGFLENWRSWVKDFLCFETHENFSSPLDIDNAWDMLALQLGMFWVGMDICPHSCLIKEKKSKKERRILMWYSSLLHSSTFSSLDTAVFSHLGQCWHHVIQGEKTLLLDTAVLRFYEVLLLTDASAFVLQD